MAVDPELTNKMRQASLDPEGWDVPSLLEDAADEIERLRRELTYTEKSLEIACLGGHE